MPKNRFVWSGLLAGGCLLITPAFAQTEPGRPDPKTATPTAQPAQPSDPALSGAEPARITPEFISKFGGVMCVTLPSRRAEMGFQQPSRVMEVRVHGGAEVKKDELIVRGDDDEDVNLIKIQKTRAESDLPVQKAKAQMDLAKVEYERLEEVRTKDASSQQEVERARLTYEGSRIDYLLAQRQQTEEVLQLARMQARVDRLHIAAPFDGIIDTVSVDVGQSVSETDKIVRIVNIDKLWIDVGAPTQDAKTLLLQPGDTAWVMLDVAGSPRLRTAKVIEVSPTADLGSRTRRIRVELDNPKGPERVIAGEAAWVRFTEPSAQVASQMTGPRPID
ncbi:MAG: efflux RND transporter periplasmic adaptor subunit [Tepidisphaera sp.]|nr:efflux RND transporter periplasmic adaptor subunit [Tepidisphaera sp.]